MFGIVVRPFCWLVSIMSDTDTTYATWKGTADGRLPKNQRNKLLVEAEAYGLTLNDLAATCEEFGASIYIYIDLISGEYLG